MKKRDASIELWRIICMLAVVASHVFYNNGIIEFSWFFWHIPGFLIISGFFGIRFSIWKVVKLLGVCYGCNWLTLPFRSDISISSVLSPCGGWYLGFYLVLMFLAPLLNAAFENRKKLSAIFITVGSLWLFAMLPRMIPIPQANFLRIDGMVDIGFLFIIIIYTLGFVAKLRDNEIMRFLKPLKYFVLLVFMLGIGGGRFL